jgi:POLQ-like helicase
MASSTTWSRRIGFLKVQWYAVPPNLHLCSNTAIGGARCASTVGLVVVDEIHMLGDTDRGNVLESFLTKVLYFGQGGIQILGMSATVSNLPDLWYVARSMHSVCAFR